jgi:hypothetical protein
MRDPKAGLTFGYSPPYRKGFTTKLGAVHVGISCSARRTQHERKAV